MIDPSALAATRSLNSALSALFSPRIDAGLRKSQFTVVVVLSSGGYGHLARHHLALDELGRVRQLRAPGRAELAGEVDLGDRVEPAPVAGNLDQRRAVLAGLPGRRLESLPGDGCLRRVVDRLPIAARGEIGFELVADL